LKTPKVKRVVVRFYRLSQGREPVRKWLKGLGDEDRKRIGDDLQTVEFAWPVGMPVCRPMVGCPGLWEVRTSLRGGRIARVFFAIVQGEMILLHGILKDTRKTPKHEVDLAVQRMKEIKGG